jgi:hypothetical protein
MARRSQARSDRFKRVNPANSAKFANSASLRQSPVFGAWFKNGRNRVTGKGLALHRCSVAHTPDKLPLQCMQRMQRCNDAPFGLYRNVLPWLERGRIWRTYRFIVPSPRNKTPIRRQVGPHQRQHSPARCPALRAREVQAAPVAPVQPVPPRWPAAAGPCGSAPPAVTPATLHVGPVARLVRHVARR